MLIYSTRRNLLLGQIFVRPAFGSRDVSLSPRASTGQEAGSVVGRPLSVSPSTNVEVCHARLEVR